MSRLRYSERAGLTKNPVAKHLFQIMETKKSNLCVAADMLYQEDLLRLAEKVGPYISVLKTHIDIIKDFTPDLLNRLQKIAKEQQFILFEDRKFADIGQTVQSQYKDGIYQIASWAHVVNAHILPGPGIIKGLQEVGLPNGRGLLLLAEMSSAGNLLHGEYTKSAVHMAYEYPDFVIGFISQRKIAEDPRFLHFTPGVHLQSAGDHLGQQYQSPEQIIGKNGSDVMIVGRGIIQAPDPAVAAEGYRKAGWEAYNQT
jgi:uridine monophosphate synthetase